MTAAPQTRTTGTTSSGVAPKVAAASRQHTPLVTMATTAARARPTRSPSRPDTTQPAAPHTPSATKVSAPTPAAPTSVPRAANPAARKNGSQAHTAYSSHMWPR